MAGPAAALSIGVIGFLHLRPETFRRVLRVQSAGESFTAVVIEPQECQPIHDQPRTGPYHENGDTLGDSDWQIQLFYEFCKPVEELSRLVRNSESIYKPLKDLRAHR